MRHQVAHRKFSRSTAHRRALMRNMATSFFLLDSFETTLEKAKDLRPVVEKLITLGRTDTLHARRQAYSFLMNKDAVHRLFTEVAPQFKTRPGGYVRVVRTRRRTGDAAEMALISLVKDEQKAAKKKAASKKRATTKKKTEEQAEAAAS